jgi:hypothetical protein
MDTRKIVDYAQDNNGVEFRNALYSTIHDKVTAHIEAAKQAVAQNLMQPEEDTGEEDSVENS